MKFCESGMPDQEMWDQFFNSDVILDELGFRDLTGNIVDLGCGYGTFTIPAARKNKGMIYALDIEENMITVVQQKSREAGLKNVLAIQRDFLAEGTGLPDRSCEYVLLFNILDADEPLKIRSETKRILVLGGKVTVIHWNHDSTSPRGPSMEIRPRPDHVSNGLEQAASSWSNHSLIFRLIITIFSATSVTEFQHSNINDKGSACYDLEISSNSLSA